MRKISFTSIFFTPSALNSILRPYLETRNSVLVIHLDPGSGSKHLNLVLARSEQLDLYLGQGIPEKTPFLLGIAQSGEGIPLSKLILTLSEKRKSCPNLREGGVGDELDNVQRTGCLPVGFLPRTHATQMPHKQSIL